MTLLSISNYFHNNAAEHVIAAAALQSNGNFSASWKSTSKAWGCYACDAITNGLLVIPSALYTAKGGAEAIWTSGARSNDYNLGCRLLKKNVNRVALSTLGLISPSTAHSARDTDVCKKVYNGAAAVLGFLRQMPIFVTIPVKIPYIGHIGLTTRVN